MSVVEAPPKDDRDIAPVSTVDAAHRLLPSPASRSSLRGTPPLTLPPPQPVPPPLSWKRSWAAIILAGLVVLLLLSDRFLLVPLLSRSPGPSGVPTPLRQGGIVMAVRTQGAGELLVRVPGGNLVSLTLTGKQLLTQDGHSLAMSSIRLGDTVKMQSGSVVLDTAQVRTSVRGIVAMSPGARHNVMAVQVHPGRTILVEIGRQTRINEKLPSVASRMSIMDADQVRVVGILDKTFDEMTQTWTIDRVDVPAAPSSRSAAQA